MPDNPTYKKLVEGILGALQSHGFGASGLSAAWQAGLAGLNAPEAAASKGRAEKMAEALDKALKTMADAQKVLQSALQDAAKSRTDYHQAVAGVGEAKANIQKADADFQNASVAVRIAQQKVQQALAGGDPLKILQEQAHLAGAQARQSQAKAAQTTSRVRLRQARQRRQEAKAYIPEADRIAREAYAHYQGTQQAVPEARAKAREAADKAAEEAKGPTSFHALASGLGDVFKGAGFEKLGGALGELGQLAKGGPAGAISFLVGQGKAAAGEAGNAFRSSRFEDVGGHAMNAASHLALMTGPMAVIAYPLTKFGEALFDGVGKLRSWSDTLHQANMQFAEFSGAMAAVQARQFARDVQLQQVRGARRAGSAEYLAEGRMELEKAVAPWEDAWANIKGEVFGYLDKVAAKFITLLANLPGIKDALDTANRPTNAQSVDDMLEQAGRADWSRTYGLGPNHQAVPMGWLGTWPRGHDQNG